MAPPDSIFGARDEVDLAQRRSRSLAVILGVSVRLNRPKRRKSLPRYKRLPTRKKSVKSFALMSRLAGFPPKTDPLRQNPDGQKGSLHLERGSTSDKRDDISAHALRIGGCPVCHSASWPRLPPASAGRCGVSQIVKTAQ